MKFFRLIGSLAFVAGLFIAIFIGGIWHVYTSVDIPLWLKIAIYFLLGGILLVLVTVAVEQQKGRAKEKELPPAESQYPILLQNSTEVPGHKITKNLGLVQGHTIFAIWIGRDLSFLPRSFSKGRRHSPHSRKQTYSRLFYSTGPFHPPSRCVPPLAIRDR